ncbi:MAG: serine/threonine-protein kinase PknK, partial [Leptolyngbyaceae bacterium]|nr:serine/threonine-protein kinase PknK [Leptolyngbyaceae bacterium]
LPIAIQLADILHHLHHCRVIHKDIKPANILIHPDTYDVKLADFSISTLLPKEQQAIQNPNVLEGTLAYIAPEQTGRMNRGIDYRADFYALGVTLYELLTGQLPFTASDPMEVVHCHIAQPPPPMAAKLGAAAGRDGATPSRQAVRPAIPLMLEQIVLKLMAKNAEDRYQSALGLKADLDYCWAQQQTTGAIPQFTLGWKDQGDRFLVPEKLYGRVQEVHTLLTAFERVALPLDHGKGTFPQSASQSELMLVAGYSGVGKTAVINEVHKPIARQRGYFIKGKFDQFQRDIPFSAFVQAFRDLMGQLLAESDARLERWKTQILAALGENGQVMVDVIPELAAIIGPQPAVPELSDSASRNRFNRLFTQFIQVFTQPEHPLVLFLDDLQWADAASLQLLSLVMGEGDAGYLLILGAYRDNEVSPAHPLMLTLDEIGATGGIIHTLTLQPLRVVDLRQLVADTLHCSQDRAAPLTDLIYRKTHGNPFFATQFLKGLYDEGLIVYDGGAVDKMEDGATLLPELPEEARHSGRSGWQCDMTRVRELALTDDVVEFMGRQLKLLPPETQAVLTMAACIGNQFDLETLAVVCERSPAEVAQNLWTALHKEAIVPLNETYKFYQTVPQGKKEEGGTRNEEFSHSPTAPLSHSSMLQPTISYKFLHDRVQQAAYTLIASADKQATHLKIGQRLLQSIPAEQHQTRIFEIVNQLNFGVDLIESRAEKCQLAQLNLKAGQKAKQSTAYQGAIRYFSTALQLLGEEPWTTDYDLALTLHNDLAMTCFVSGEFDQMERYLDAVFTHAQTLLDQVLAHDVQIQSYLVRGRLKQTIESAIAVAQSLGIVLPQTVDEVEALVQTTKAKVTENGNDPSSLIHLPMMTDAQVEAAVQVLASANSAAYVGHPEYLPSIVSQQVALLVEYGNTPLSAFVYAWYGTFLSKNPALVEQGYQFGQLALEMLEAFPSPAIKAKTQFMVHCMIFHWKNHVQETLAPLLDAYQHGRDNGDIEYASWAILVRCEHLFCMGHPLPELDAEFQTAETAIQQFKQASALLHTQIFHQATLNLLGQTEQPEQLVGEKFDARRLPELRQQALEQTGVFHAYLCELILSYTFEAFEQALEQADLARQFQGAASALLAIAPFYLYDSLIRLAHYPNVPLETQSQLMAQVTQNQAQLQQWAIHAPQNHQHKYDLVEAERCRVLGDRLQAIDLYDRAIAQAQASGYHHEEALANELTARFYLDWNKLTVAQAYMQAAYYGYARWGAKAKVNQLEQRYPQLLGSILSATLSEPDPLDPRVTRPQTTTTYYPSNTFSRTSSQMSDVLDFASVLKSTQALSSTMELHDLLNRLAWITLENSGAETCVLILPRSTIQDQWEIRAIAQVENLHDHNLHRPNPSRS